MPDNQEPHAEWIRRKESILKFQEVLARAIITENTDRAGTLRALLACLQEFGNRQFDFFADKFDNAKFPATPRHPLYAPEYFFDVTLNQIGYDTDVLLRAGQQRSIQLPPQNEISSNFDATLANADRLAWAALSPAIRTKLIEPATAFTYYQKSPSVRLIPYAPVAWVGVPYSATNTERDLAAIAHEVGHFVASRLVDADTADTCGGNTGLRPPAQRRSIANKRVGLGAEPQVGTASRWLSGWDGEVFADVYACIVSGPMSGFTMLDSLRRLPATRWMEDDREHPLPILRPRIYAMTLRAMARYVDSALGCSLETTARLLDDATDAWLGGALPEGLIFTPHGGSPMRLTLALQLIEDAVNRLVRDDLALLRPQGNEPGRLWTQPPYGREHIGRSIEELLATLTDAPPELHFGSPPPSVSSGAAQTELWAEGATGLDMDWERARDGDADAVCVLEQAGWNPWWLAVLSAGFWTTEGPGAGNPQPPS